MNAIVVSSIVFGSIFGASLIGMLLRRKLPKHHLSSESKDIVMLGTGLVGTMSALILGLLIASAKSSYDTEKDEITQLSAKIIFLDRILANYGTESGDARKLLRDAVAAAIERIWPANKSELPQLDPSSLWTEGLYNTIQQLPAATDLRSGLKVQALDLVTELGQMRWLLYEQMGSSISTPLMVVVIFWLTFIFTSFGLYAPPNGTVFFTLFVCAFSVTGALFLIMELDHPFHGLIQISSDPMQSALEHLGK